MTPMQWDQIELVYEGEFGRKMRGNRWKNKFENLDYDMVMKAIDIYAEESNSAPTVSQLMACLPKGLVKRAKVDHMHAWDELPLSHEMSGLLVWCNTCGDHHPERCGCERCICSHVSAKRISKRFYYCPDCDGCIRAREEDPDVPF